MNKRKYIKLMSAMLVFVLTVSLNIDINMGDSWTSPSPNKHFLQLGIGEVEAAGEWVFYKGKSMNSLPDFDYSSVSVMAIYSNGIYKGIEYDQLINTFGEEVKFDLKKYKYKFILYANTNERRLHSYEKDI